MSFRVRVEPGGLQFEAAPGERLVLTAQHAGIELPSSCRNGTCRTCICQIRSGRAQHLVEWPGLSSEEKAEGWILPCVAEALSDVTLEVPLAYLIFSERARPASLLTRYGAGAKDARRPE